MILDEFLAKSKLKPKKVVYPEGEDERLIQAASYCVREGIAYPILIGSKSIIEKKAIGLGIDLGGIQIIQTSDFDYSDDLFNIINFSKKRIDKKEAQNLSKNPLYIGALLVRKNLADICIGGAINDTADVIKAGLYVIGLKENIKLLSSFFLMELPTNEFGENGVLFFADCGVNPDPNASELADIAIATADNFSMLMNAQPKVAMLSFSTKASAKHKILDKVIEATNIVKQKRPDILVDGELQADAALVESVALRKAPDSPIKGHANVLIFPDLNAGNIAYKLVERLAKAQAIGPIMQGLKKPMHDLSRGCKYMDIVYLTAISSFQV
ncbi:MAG: phosphate acetyltransferase [Desulfurella sp.]|uniref:phosphate acetyltransferase n=1 Tax=Desulfurella sp. TaxID=1962857 RepID=UPI003C70C6E4